MSDPVTPLELAAQQFPSKMFVYSLAAQALAAKIVRVYLSAKVEEMEHPRPDSVYFEGCDGEAIGVSVPVKDVLAALLPVVSEDGGAQ